MTDLTTGTTPSAPSTTGPPADQTPAHWPDDPNEMLNEMMSEQANSLHNMFGSLRDYAGEVFPTSPHAAQVYIRLALRAQANCRSTMESIVRADPASRRDAAAPAK